MIDEFDNALIDGWDKRGDTHPAVAVAKRLRASNLRLEGLCLAAKSALHTLQIALNVANEERDGWRERALRADLERNDARWMHANLRAYLRSKGLSPDRAEFDALDDECRAVFAWLYPEGGSPGSTEDDSSDGR